MDFASLSLSDKIVNTLTTLGYTAPTPIQAKAIPLVLQGRDVLGCAQTGTGKTASYVLPILDILSQGRSRAMMPRAMILLPTRELALQVEASFVEYGAQFKLKTALIIGGVSSGKQEQSLSRGVDVVIATPGRFLDLYERGRLLLADIKTLVVDEADRMLDMGFIPDLQKITALLPRGRQTILLSATMPKEIKKLATSMLSDPKEVTVSPPTQTGENITQKLVHIHRTTKDADYDKRCTLRALLKDQNINSAIIFCNRKKDVDTLQRSLTRHKFKVRGLHGDMSQGQRSEALEAFKSGSLPFLIASDIAARGVDVEELPNVINYDVPHNGEDYIHRIGRTGRAGKKGAAWTLVGARDVKALEAVKSTIKLTLPYLEGFSPTDSPAGVQPPTKGGHDTQGPKPTQSRSPKPKTVKEGPLKDTDSIPRKRPTPDQKTKTPPSPPSKGFGEHVPAFMRRT